MIHACPLSVAPTIDTWEKRVALIGCPPLPPFFFCLWEAAGWMNGNDEFGPIYASGITGYINEERMFPPYRSFAGLEKVFLSGVLSS